MTRYNPDGSIEILSNGKLMTKYFPDGSKNEYWKGFLTSRYEPRNGALIFETSAKFPIMNSGSELYSHPVLLNAPSGTEANFKDSDGLIKKAIKQYDGRWTRISDNSKV